MRNIITIVGAGPAGIGVGLILKKAKIPFQIIEKDSIGSSFKKWPKEMRLISPSFTGNFFGSADLNAISPDTSPAYTLKTEHPTGKEYAKYLEAVASNYELPIRFGIEVKSIEKKEDLFFIETNKGTINSVFVIWAAGEYQYPKKNQFEGSELCIHNSKVKSWKDLEGDSFVVIGGYESGIDAAFQLSKLKKDVHVLDSTDRVRETKSDSSYTLSPFTRDRYHEYKDRIKISTNSQVNLVEKYKGKYKIQTKSGKVIMSETQPILATGFESSLSLVNDHFEFEDGSPKLTDGDESTKTEGLFLVGPQVKHKEAIFCFIYKYRQRFAIVVEEISHRLGLLKEVDHIIAEYQKKGFYLHDLSCCGDECPC